MGDTAGTTKSTSIPRNTTAPITFTITTPVRRARVFFGTTTNTTYDETFTLQLERGDTASTFAPYFAPIQLCRIGTKQDYIYKSNGNWYVHKDLGNVLLDGTESWAVYGSADRGIKWDNSTISAPTYTSSEIAPVYVDYFSSKPRLDIYNRQVDYGIAIDSTSVYMRNSALSTLDGYTDWLKSHPTSLYYVLATPTDTQITDATLISQLEAVAALQINPTDTTTIYTSYLPAILVTEQGSNSYLEPYVYYNGNFIKVE